MHTALVVGGTRFIGRHLVEDLLAHGYDVTTLTRGESGNPFAEDDRVNHVAGDRTDRATLERAREAVEPNLVVDMVAYHPADVEAAVDVFADVDAYVYVSSGSAYAGQNVPMREDTTPLESCTAAQAIDESMETYGNRKAECDRVAFRAADEGVNATVVRPMLVYGPHDYTERFAYWVDRVAEYDRVLVPGDGGSLLHRAYVEDVARALRVVAEEGTPGEAYNVADRVTCSLERSLELVADALDTDVEVVHAGERDLAAAGLSPSSFALYTPRPALASTEKLAALGWESTPLETAVARTVDHHREHGFDGADHDPGRADEERVIEAVRGD